MQREHLTEEALEVFQCKIIAPMSWFENWQDRQTCWFHMIHKQMLKGRLFQAYLKFYHLDFMLFPHYLLLICIHGTGTKTLEFPHALTCKPADLSTATDSPDPWTQPGCSGPLPLFLQHAPSSAWKLWIRLPLQLLWGRNACYVNSLHQRASNRNVVMMSSRDGDSCHLISLHMLSISTSESQMWKSTSCLS